jgi:hypothetical protein
VQLPPQLSRFKDGEGGGGSVGIDFNEALGDVPQNDALPISVRDISLPLNVLQPFQITEVDAMKSVLSTGAPSISEKGDKQKVVC